MKIHLPGGSLCLIPNLFNFSVNFFLCFVSRVADGACNTREQRQQMHFSNSQSFVMQCSRISRSMRPSYHCPIVVSYCAHCLTFECQSKLHFVELNTSMLALKHFILSRYLQMSHRRYVFSKRYVTQALCLHSAIDFSESSSQYEQKTL